MRQANYYPDRLVISWKRNNTLSKMQDAYTKRYGSRSLAPAVENSASNLSKTKSSLSLSTNSVRNLRESVNSLVFLSKPRTIFTPSGKNIYNFRASFITLTLPAAQKHTDVELKKCLDLFLQDLRRVYNVNNYVWRSELQKNGNIHFHLVIDVYIHHKIIRNYWLKALRNTGYVQDYQKKFYNMPFVDYRNFRLKNLAKPPQDFKAWNKKIVAAYAYGKRTSWLSPNCTDVKSVFNVNQMAAYVSKYMAKEAKKNKGASTENQGYIASMDRVESFGKVWGRSTSLSKLKYNFPFALDDVKPFIQKLIKCGAVFHKVFDWVEVYYFRFDKMPSYLYKRIAHHIFGVAKTWSYPLTT